MKVRDIFEQMLFGEFSQMMFTCRDPDTGELKNVDRIVAHINAGIIELHKRFMIRKGIAYLCADGCEYRYKLYKGAPYLECFEDRDLMEVLEVMPCNGPVARLNSTGRWPPRGSQSCCLPMDIQTPAYNVIQVPRGFCGYLQITYKPAPWLVEYSLDKTTDYIPETKAIYDDGGNLLRYEFVNIPQEKTTPKTILDMDVDLPEMYLMALLYFIGSRIFTTLQQEIKGDPLDRKFYDKYEDECARLMSYGYDMEGVGRPEERFTNGGFV